MSVFDQRGQKVTYQYNAASNINFSAVQNRVDLISELEKLKTEISKASDAQIIDNEMVTDIQYEIQKAIDQSNKPEPSKNHILGHLGNAKDFMKGVVEAGGLVAGIVKAIELVQKLF
jgi:hypothetical protein